jgi:hypothetical protein
MKTSYFSKAGTLSDSVSIARTVPIGWKGKRYIELAPPWELIQQYKVDLDCVLFENHYKTFVLDKLDPEFVYNQLGDNAILLCWEGKGKFCHRRLVAKWFEKHLSISVPEL